MNNITMSMNADELILSALREDISSEDVTTNSVRPDYCLGEVELICKQDGRMIGTCGFTSFNCPADSAEIGYVLNPAFQGKGLATEAVRRVLRFGFEELSLHRIEAHFILGNEASRRLMERVGMTFEGYARESMKIKGRYRTIGTCAILRGEFEER